MGDKGRCTQTAPVKTFSAVTQPMGSVTQLFLTLQNRTPDTRDPNSPENHKLGTSHWKQLFPTVIVSFVFYIFFSV